MLGDTIPFSLPFSFVAYGLFFMDVFINLPMNGVWSLPGKWNKDSTISYGLMAVIVLSSYLTAQYPLPLYISIPYIFLNVNTSWVNLMNFIPNSWIKPPSVRVTQINFDLDCE